MIFNEFEDNFVFACNFPSKLSLFGDHLFTQSLELFRISVKLSFLEGKLPVPGRPTVLITVGQGPTALAVGAGEDCLDIFTLIYPFSSLSPSLWETARYRLKYCLKGSLNPKQPTNQSFLEYEHWDALKLSF